LWAFYKFYECFTKNRYIPMRNFTILLAALVAFTLPAMSQPQDQAAEAQNDSVATVEAASGESEAVTEDFAGDEEIAIKYAPNTFADNWELNVAGGISVLFNGLGHIDETNSAPVVSGSRKFYDAVGGVGEITATKWFNPYVAMRIGWMAGYLPFNASKSAPSSIAEFDNYIHGDALWDWTTQFGGYKPDRIYDAVPYLHVGVAVNPGFNAGVAGGIGYLSRFHVAEHWIINLDLRSTLTTARKYGLPSGIAVNLNALVGVSYRFDKVGWKKKVENPYKDALHELRAANSELEQQRNQATEEAEKLKDAVSQRDQERKDIAKLVDAITKDTVFYGAPDTMEMTVYYAINSSELSSYERAHMDTYLRLISLNDPNYTHMYKVIGSADAATGTREINERTAQRRADAIREVLIQNGVDPENITTEIEVVEGGDVQLSRASHVIIYPVEKPKLVIPDSLNFDE
jgi:outer membrane protein OmpA-like peptidoglycan-associated protein